MSELRHSQTAERWATFKDGRVCCSGAKPNYPRCPANCAAQTPQRVIVNASGSVERPPATRTNDGYDPYGTPENPYESGTAYIPEPTDDPAYRPFGTPPDSYALAFASEKLQAERKKERG